MEPGVHSLHANFHHKITYGKFNLNVICPPLYERKIGNYKLENSECTRNR